LATFSETEVSPSAKVPVQRFKKRLTFCRCVRAEQLFSHLRGIKSTRECAKERLSSTIKDLVLGTASCLE